MTPFRASHCGDRLFVQADFLKREAMWNKCISGKQSKTLQQEGCSSVPKYCWVNCVSSEVITFWKWRASQSFFEHSCVLDTTSLIQREKHSLVTNRHSHTLCGTSCWWASLLSFDLICKYLTLNSVSGLNAEWKTLSSNLNQSEVGFLLGPMKPRALGTDRATSTGYSSPRDYVCREF